MDTYNISLSKTSKKILLALLKGFEKNPRGKGLIVEDIAVIIMGADALVGSMNNLKLFRQQLEALPSKAHESFKRRYVKEEARERIQREMTTLIKSNLVKSITLGECNRYMLTENGIIAAKKIRDELLSIINEYRMFL